MRITIVCLALISVGPGTFVLAESAKTIEKKVDFPFPVEWKPDENIEIALLSAALGPVRSPDMLAKGRESSTMDKPKLDNQPEYVLALHLRAKLAGAPGTEMFAQSYLLRVKNVEGDVDVPADLTPAGLVPFRGSPGVYDVHFNKTNTTEFWDFFPVSQEDKEFLFQAFSTPDTMPTSENRIFSFKIVLNHGELEIRKPTPAPAYACLQGQKQLVGTLAGTSRSLELTIVDTTLTGTEQYGNDGQTRQLKGDVDSLGNFAVEERYPEERVTGIFKGKFSSWCRLMTGYFSQLKTSELQRFQFRQIP